MSAAGPASYAPSTTGGAEPLRRGPRRGPGGTGLLAGNPPRPSGGTRVGLLAGGQLGTAGTS